jgi:hypothetical protein
MQLAAGVGVLLVATALIWTVINLLRHPEFRFWRHPILLGVFPRVRLTFGATLMTAGLVLVGLSLIMDE